MAEAAAETTKSKPGWRTLARSLKNPKSGFMALFGFASGLPFALFLGTLYAWLSEAEVELETMGVFSLIGLAYAFQFLWSPLIDKVSIPGFRKLGRRKQWIVPAQILLGVILIALSLSNPTNEAIGWFSLLAGIGALASATQDIAINAWRIDVADEDATLDILSTVYQMGFRLAALVGGALGLIIAARIGWPQTYLIMGGILLAIGIAGLFAPDSNAGENVDGTMDDDLLLSLREKGRIEAQDPRPRAGGGRPAVGAGDRRRAHLHVHVAGLSAGRAAQSHRFHRELRPLDHRGHGRDPGADCRLAGVAEEQGRERDDGRPA